MSRERRLNRNLPVDIDVSAIWRIAEQIGATQKQFRNAYSRALRRTGATLRKQAMADLKTGLAPRSLQMMRKRILSFSISRGSQLDTAKLWFGLNAVKVKDLKGKVRGRIRPHHNKRDPTTGRFIKARRRKMQVVGFDPKGAIINPESYPDGEVARSKREGRRTILIRDPTTRRTHEAEVDIYAPLLDRIEDNAFAKVMEIFMHHFETDLKGRIKARIDV